MFGIIVDTFSELRDERVCCQGHVIIVFDERGVFNLCVHKIVQGVFIHCV